MDETSLPGDATRHLHVDVVSAQESLYSGAAHFVAVPGEMGELGVLPRHAPLITRIRPGAVHIVGVDGAGEEFIFVAGGILEIQGDRVTVLADTAIRARDLDEAKAEAARQRAADAMRTAASTIDFAQAQSEFLTMAAQIAALRRYRRG